MDRNYECSKEEFRKVIESKLYLKKFIIFPYGKWGRYAKEVLEEYGVKDYLVSDRSFIETKDKEITIDDAKQKKEYYILLCSNNKALYAELRKEVREISHIDNIIDVCYYGSTFAMLKYEKNDSRIKMLELCSREIYENRIEGEVAEAGVYRGDFAKYINELFPDKKLYLFDTYSGFVEKDCEYDRDNKFSLGIQDWSKTSIELVLNKMPFKDNCIVRKGFFPETAENMSKEEMFCFVSLDMDLYQPIYKGLEFFYPRLVKGGYIFIHDCRNIAYVGARQALLDFCKQYKVGYTILVDSEGSAVITK